MITQHHAGLPLVHADLADGPDNALSGIDAIFDAGRDAHDRLPVLILAALRFEPAEISKERVVILGRIIGLARCGCAGPNDDVGPGDTGFGLI